MTKTARILSLDGGGIRGIIPALVLAEIERRTGKPISDLFHLVAGTSTGGILAAGLSLPHGGGPVFAATDLVALYRDRGREIFHRSLWKGFTSLGGMTDEKYSHANLERILRETLGNALLSSVRTDIMVTAYDLERRNPHFFKSWKAQGRELDKETTPPERARDRDFFLRDICRATSAAPTYFEPALIRSGSRERYALVDGGVFANNPAMCAYVSAKRIFPAADRYVIVSLGTGELERPIPYEDARNWGLVRWIRPILSVIMDGVEDTVHYQLKQIFERDSYFRFQTDLDRFGPGDDGPNDDFDDASSANIAKLTRKADILIAAKAPRLERLCQLLSEPVTDRAALGYPLAD
ncbi:MAG: patatin [Rhodospirillales bacterium]|nr:MAG: patatin [Rhodospirillales bacterium]